VRGRVCVGNGAPSGPPPTARPPVSLTGRAAHGLGAGVDVLVFGVPKIADLGSEGRRKGRRRRHWRAAAATPTPRPPPDLERRQPPARRRRPQQHVLQLDVPVGDAQLVRELEGDDELLEERARDGFGEATRRARARPPSPAALPVREHKLKHVAPGSVLHDDGQVARREERLLEADDVRVRDAEPVVEHLAQRAARHPRPALQEFDGDLGVGSFVEGELDKAKRALRGEWEGSAAAAPRAPARARGAAPGPAAPAPGARLIARPCEGRIGRPSAARRPGARAPAPAPPAPASPPFSPTSFSDRNFT